jgi:hypothetical protein
LLFSISILCKHYSSFPCNSSSYPTNNVRKAESLRSSLRELEGLLEEYSPLLSGSVEKVVDKVVKYGTVFAEVGSPIWKTARG